MEYKKGEEKKMKLTNLKEKKRKKSITIEVIEEKEGELLAFSQSLKGRCYMSYSIKDSSKDIVFSSQKIAVSYIEFESVQDYNQACTEVKEKFSV